MKYLVLTTLLIGLLHSGCVSNLQGSSTVDRRSTGTINVVDGGVSSTDSGIVPPPPGLGTQTDGGAIDSTDPYRSYRTHCLELVNRYRSMAGVPSVTEIATKNNCADGQAASDAQANMLHSSAGRCSEKAQNGSNPYATHDVIWLLDNTFDDMWNRSPAHKATMINTTYTKVACGFGKVQYSGQTKPTWVTVQDYFQ